ncbi:MAG: DUF4340 domain-containing protein [Gammaproteobacteria bacterium]
MKKSLPLFAIVTLLFVIAAWFSVQQRSLETVVNKEPLYPELANKIQDVAKVELRTHELETVLSAKNDLWVLENRGSYPAHFNRIKPLVIALSKLEIREAKTANPELYSRLQVEDITDEKAKSKQAVLKDSKGNVLVSLLIGKERINRTDGSTDSLYVRKTGEENTYLVKGEVSLSADPADWFENKLINLSSDRLKSISIQHGSDKTVGVLREDKTAVNYELQNIPEGFKVKSQTTLNSLATIVEELHFDDVNSSTEFKWPDETLITVYETFGGLVAKIKSSKIENKTWAAFTFEFTGKEEPKSEAQNDEEKSKIPSVKQQVELLNAKTDGWVYALPSHKAQQLTRKLSDLIIEEGQDSEKQSPMPGMSSEMPEGMTSELPPGVTPEMLQEMMQSQGQPQ